MNSKTKRPGKGSKAIQARADAALRKEISSRQKAEGKLKAFSSELQELKAALDEHAIVAITAPSGKITYVNDKFCAISKYSRRELIGQDHRIINSGYHSKKFIRDLWTTIAHGKVWHGEIKNRAKDGSFYWVATTIVPFLDERGKPRQYVAIRADITEQKMLLEKLAQQAEIIESSNDAIVSKNLDGIITSWNPAAEKLFGYQAKECLGKSVLMLFPLDRVKEEADILSKVRRGIRVEPFDTVRVAKNGDFIDVSVTTSPMRNEQGEIIGASTIARDITERKQAGERAAWLASFPELNPNPIIELDIVTGEIHYANAVALAWFPYLKKLKFKHPLLAGLETETKPLLEGKVPSLYREVLTGNIAFAQTVTYIAESRRVRLYHADITQRKRAEDQVKKLNAELEQRVRQRTQELEAANEELKAFSYTISHDLRAPLRAMNGFARILEMQLGNTISPEAKHAMKRIQDNASKMGELIDGLLDFSSLNFRPVTKSKINPGEVAQTVFDELRPDFAGRNVELKIDILPPCEADPTLLRQVFVNLLSNAIKYSRDRNPAVIHVGVEKDGDETAYFVQDNGAGFNMEYAEKLFRVFQRLHTADQFAGTGVGLAIVQRIVQRHGGRVWAEAEEDRGAKFYFTLERNHG